MRRFPLLILAAVLMAGVLLPSTAHAQGSWLGKPAPQTTVWDACMDWWKELFGMKPTPRKPDCCTAEAPPNNAGPNRPGPTKPTPNSADVVAQDRANAEAALMRRIDVCDRLRNAALEKGDEALMRQADEMNDRAWAAYRGRMDTLGTGRSRFESDEQAMDRRLGELNRGSTLHQTVPYRPNPGDPQQAYNRENRP